MNLTLWKKKKKAKAPANLNTCPFSHIPLFMNKAKLFVSKQLLSLWADWLALFH